MIANPSPHVCIEGRGRRWAQDVARHLGHFLRANIPGNVRLRAFLRHLRVDVQRCRLDGTNATLVRIGDRATIYLSDRITDERAIRFTIAHELGHLILGHPSTPIRALVTGRSGYSHEHEAEASAFASELLLPRDLVAHRCDVHRVDLEVPHQLAHDYVVSILVSTRRFTELSPQRCCAVFCIGGHVLWISKSDSMLEDIQIGRLLQPEALAARYFIDGWVDTVPRRVPAHAWFDMPSNTELVEHAICSPKHRTVLSLLWLPDGRSEAKAA